MFTKKQVQQMKEEDLRRKVLIPLLQAMKYQDVQEYHGGKEFGKDIVCWKSSDLGSRKNLALVVKAVPVTGKAKVDKGTTGEIQTQINQCFGRTYLDPVTSSTQSVHQCWVVSNHAINETAIEAIRAAMGNSVHKENVDFVGIDKLWDLICCYLPFQATFQKLEDVQRDFETWDTHYRIDTTMNGSGIHHTLAEKFPGAFQEKPVEIKSAFSFPDTEEGREMQRAVELFVETGAPVKIPKQYIKKLEVSEFLQGVYPSITEMTEDGFLQLTSTPNPMPILLRCEIIRDDGYCFTLEYLHLLCRQAGTKEATLTNEGQPIPIKIELVICSDTTFGCRFQIDPMPNVPLNAYQLFMQLRLMRCLSQPCTIRLTSLETGLPVLSGRAEASVANIPEEDFFEDIEALNALQLKSRKIVLIPDRDPMDEEMLVIHKLRTLFRTGKIPIPCVCASRTVTDEVREEVLQSVKEFKEKGSFELPLRVEESVILFGNVYPLGPIKPLRTAVKLANASEAEAFLAQGVDGELVLEFVPGNEEETFLLEYENWLPPTSPL